MKQRIFTLQQIYKEGTAILQRAGIEEASLDAWYLLEYVTGISKASYYGEPGKEVEEELAKKYLEVIEVRSRRIPLQHITGEQEFMGYPFYVNEHVLIPRQDTEVLVEETVKIIKAQGCQTASGTSEMISQESYRQESDKHRWDILDMCTGSGCIILSILKMCPGINGTGCDISGDALKVAKKNAERLGVEMTFVRSDLFEAWKNEDSLHYDAQSASKCDMQDISELKDKYDLIVSNPPYIRTEVIEELQEEVRLHDPRLALDGREDGLYFYRRIVEDSVHYIKDGGYLVFEIGHDQGNDVSCIMERGGYRNIMVKKDLAGLDRVVIGMYNKR